MLCPKCGTGCFAEDMYCRQCGADLTIPSTSLVTTHANLPALLNNPQLPRVAAGVGALAFGVGIELLRRSLLARLAQTPRSATKLLPAPILGGLRDVLLPQGNKAVKVPKGYEIHETAVYFKRVIRREV